MDTHVTHANTSLLIRWFQQELGGGESFEQLDQLAAGVGVGSGGVVVLDGFQGNRTPHTDSRVRGAVWGLSLATSRTHLYRAMLEGVAYGARAMVCVWGRVCMGCMGLVGIVEALLWL